jgi:hypothetical protein
MARFQDHPQSSQPPSGTSISISSPSENLRPVPVEPKLGLG